MNKLIKLVPAIILATALTSCGGKKISHEEAKSLYIDVFVLKQKVTLSSNKLIEEYNFMHKLANLNHEGPVEGTYADELLDKVYNFQKLLDSTINIVSTMKDLDKDIKIVESLQRYLEKEKSLWEDGMINSIKYHKIGLKNLNDEQALDYEAIPSMAMEAEQFADAMTDDLTKFARKYKIFKPEVEDEINTRINKK